MEKFRRNKNWDQPFAECFLPDGVQRRFLVGWRGHDPVVADTASTSLEDSRQELVVRFAEQNITLPLTGGAA